MGKMLYDLCYNINLCALIFLLMGLNFVGKIIFISKIWFTDQLNIKVIVKCMEISRFL